MLSLGIRIVNDVSIAVPDARIIGVGNFGETGFFFINDAR